MHAHTHACICVYTFAQFQNRDKDIEMLLELIGVSRADYGGVKLPKFLALHSDVMSAEQICGIPEELVRA